RWASRGSSRSGSARPTPPAGRRTAQDEEPGRTGGGARGGRGMGEGGMGGKKGKQFTFPGETRAAQGQGAKGNSPWPDERCSNCNSLPRGPYGLIALSAGAAKTCLAIATDRLRWLAPSTLLNLAIFWQSWSMRLGWSRPTTATAMPPSTHSATLITYANGYGTVDWRMTSHFNQRS